jgi:hypothetical protein
MRRHSDWMAAVFWLIHAGEQSMKLVLRADKRGQKLHRFVSWQCISHLIEVILLPIAPLACHIFTMASSRDTEILGS